MSRLEIEGEAEFVAPGLDVSSLQHSGECQLYSGAEVLCIAHTDLALVVHLGLRKEREGGRRER